MTSDREAWKDVCEEGLAAFDINYDQDAEARRARPSSTHDHKYSSIRSSLSYLWQNLRVRIRAPESSSFSPSVCFLASTASSSFIDGQQQASKTWALQCPAASINDMLENKVGNAPANTQVMYSKYK